MRLSVDLNLLGKARSILQNRGRLYWIIGGSCAGKSTVCQAISAEYGFPIYDMDAHVFGDYPRRCTEERHPAISTWFTEPNSFAWLLGLPWDESADFNRAANAEFLDLLADDLVDTATDNGMLVDGWITNPALLVQVVPVTQIVCLETAASMSTRDWEENADRRFMKEMVSQLPDPEDAWKRFLRTDGLMTRTILDECKESDVRIFIRDEHTSVSALADQIASFFGL